MEQTDLVILDLCDSIDNIIAKSEETFKRNADKINKNARLKYISLYSVLFFGYAKEIAILQRLFWNTGIHSLTRDMLECYAIIKKLMNVIDDINKFDDYIKYLILLDMDQDISIYKAIKGDTTETNISKRDITLQTFIVRFNNLINEYFPHEAANLTKRSEFKYISRIINKLLTKYNEKYYEPKAKSIGNALSNNNAWKNDNNGNCFEGAYFIYKELCHSTHNNVSSLQDRVTNYGFVMYNAPDKNIRASCSLTYYCSKDIVDWFVDYFKRTEE